MIEDLPGETVGIEVQGPFLDLCRGQHVENTGEIGPLLMRVAGRTGGDEKRPMLQRVYGRRDSQGSGRVSERLRRSGATTAGWAANLSSS
jgi:threonyl-tRNA synthetase